MENNPQAFASEYLPTRIERFWRKLGFRFHLGDEPAWMADGPQPVGWMQTRSKLRLSIGDRFRLLLTGHLRLTHTFETDTPSPTRISTRMDWEIVPPGEKRF